MRQSIAGIALISRHQDGQRQWLAQWNERWRCFNFVGGHKLDEESFRQCVVREVEEELHVRHETDFTVADERRAHLRYTTWSNGAHEETAYTIELFDVEFTDDSLADRLVERPENRWLSEADMLREKCPDGSDVSETMRSLLRRAGLLHP